ncbi:MAG: nucleotide exchange factor GrpE [Flavobacteriales bacterium]|jgi:molecular chaperone GrpE|nr:nucleotide exchange factor GrpE [Flavobacteriales bacterium]MBT6013919.1 nucleotide exchange factor GrpE [Flavobacteriales bacterium]MBT7482000.1 nucleotide exchange factor GrpE [Flavobacteriales bacterium]
MKKKKKEVIKEVENKEENTNLQEEEVKTSPTTEELLAIEKDKNIRLIAEFENFRKRNAKERIEFFSTANKDIMTSLLPILDNFERSIESNNYTDKDGTMIIYKQLKSELEKKGLNEIENPIGKELDTNFHEAITNIPAPTKKEIGKIIDSVEKGYMLGEKVIRYTKVILGK